MRRSSPPRRPSVPAAPPAARPGARARYLTGAIPTLRSSLLSGGPSRLAPGLLFLLLTLPLCLAGCGSKAQLEPEVQLTFVRSGLAIDGSQHQAEIKQDGRLISSVRLDLGENRQMLQFDWVPGTRYEVMVNLKVREVVAPQRPSPYRIRTLELESVDASAATTAIPDSTVAFSPDGKRVAVGTLNGSLLVAEVFTGKTLWKKKVAEGMVKRVEISPDGATVYAGEQSPDGFVYAFDTSSGAEKWKMRLADDLEASRPPAADDRYGVYWLPGAFQIRVTGDGRVIVAGTHSWNDNGVQKNRSRLYVLAPDGSPLWKYPEEGPMDANITWFDVDARGQTLVFATSRTATTPPKGPITGSGVFGLDLQAKKATWGHLLTPLAPFKDVFIWQAVSISPDGTRAVAGLGDGRALLFDASAPGPAAKLIQTLELGTPIEVSGVPIATPVGYTLATAQALYLQTNDSNIPAGTEASSRATPAPHPAARTLFALGSEGTMQWRYRGDFAPAGLWSSHDGRYLMMTTANAHNEARTDKHGFVMLDTTKQGTAGEKLLYAYPTVGPVFFHADLSDDGFVAAVTETPALKEDGRTLYGTYQVHLVH